MFLSQITAPTALTLPVAEICQRAREHGILTIIDGAHAPGQIDVNLAELGANFYTGTCHKWMCAPKGAAFLYAEPDSQHLLDPLVVGWGWGDHRTYHIGSDFLDHHQWLGTHDPASYLSVSAAIEFQARHNWPEVRKRCHALVVEAVNRANDLPGCSLVHPPGFYQQMGLIELHSHREPREIKADLYAADKIEVPVFDWRGRLFVRVSIQAYNTISDVETLINALARFSL